MFPTRRIVTSGGDVFRDEYSLEFDGTNDYVAISNHSNFASDTIGTISSWFKSTNSGAYGWIVTGSDDGDASSDVSLGIDSNNKLAFYVRDDGSNDIGFITTDSYNDGQWHHVAVSVAASSNIIYIDGKLAVGSYGTGSTSTQAWFSDVTGLDTLRIGNRKDSGGNQHHLVGNISEVAIYSVGLTSSQIKTIYNGREPYNHKEGIASGNLKAWYRMGDGSLDDFGTEGTICDEVTPTITEDVIADGIFDTAVAENTSGTHWITGAGIVISGGSATYDGGGDNNSQLNSVVNSSIIDNSVHKVEFNLTDTGGGGVYVRVCAGSFTLVSGTAKHTLYIMSGTGDNKLTFETGHNDKAFTLDNISVRKINGNAGAMINMDAVDITGDTP